MSKYLYFKIIIIKIYYYNIIKVIIIKNSEKKSKQQVHRYQIFCSSRKKYKKYKQVIKFQSNVNIISLEKNRMSLNNFTKFVTKH